MLQFCTQSWNEESLCSQPLNEHSYCPLLFIRVQLTVIYLIFNCSWHIYIQDIYLLNPYLANYYTKKIITTKAGYSYVIQLYRFAFKFYYTQKIYYKKSRHKYIYLFVCLFIYHHQTINTSLDTAYTWLCKLHYTVHVAAGCKSPQQCGWILDFFSNLWWLDRRDVSLYIPTKWNTTIYMYVCCQSVFTVSQSVKNKLLPESCSCLVIKFNKINI